MSGIVVDQWQRTITAGSLSGDSRGGEKRMTAVDRLPSIQTIVVSHFFPSQPVAQRIRRSHRRRVLCVRAKKNDDENRDQVKAKVLPPPFPPPTMMTIPPPTMMTMAMLPPPLRPLLLPPSPRFRACRVRSSGRMAEAFTKRSSHSL